MKTLRLVAASGRPPAWAAEAEAFYRRQLRCFELSASSVRPAAREKEAAAIIGKLPPRAHVVLLEAGGCAVDSAAFSQALEGWLARAAPVLVIGGADGAADALRQRAGETLSLSPLTFPHVLARLVLVEQLFRADCLLRRHPYPR